MDSKQWKKHIRGEGNTDWTPVDWRKKLFQVLQDMRDVEDKNATLEESEDRLVLELNSKDGRRQDLSLISELQEQQKVLIDSNKKVWKANFGCAKQIKEYAKLLLSIELVYRKITSTGLWAFSCTECGKEERWIPERVEESVCPECFSAATNEKKSEFSRKRNLSREQMGSVPLVMVGTHEAKDFSDPGPSTLIGNEAVASLKVFIDALRDSEERLKAK